MAINESAIRRIIREEARRVLRGGRRLMEQEEEEPEVAPPDTKPQLRRNAEELNSLDGHTKGSESQIHISEMISKGLFDKGSENMTRFQQDVEGFAERAIDLMHDKAFFMNDDKVKAAGAEGYQRYAYKYTSNQDWDCKDGFITDLQVFAIPTERGIVTKAFAVLNRGGRKTNIQIGGLPKKIFQT